MTDTKHWSPGRVSSVLDWYPQGKSIKENIGHGRTRTIARFDTRGLFCEGYDEGNAAHAVASAQACYGINPAAVPLMLEALRDPCMIPALESWAKGKNANAVRCLQNATAALAKAEGRS